MKVSSGDLKIQTFEKKRGGSNFNIGGATTETLPRRSPSCLFCRSSHANVCSDGDSEDSGDYNWRRLWEMPSKNSQRRYAGAWIHPLPSDLSFPESLVFPDHPIEPLDFITMSSNPTNHPIEDQFLRWRQEMEAKQEEQAKQMAELREHETIYNRRTSAYGPAWRPTGSKTRKALPSVNP